MLISIDVGLLVWTGLTIPGLQGQTVKLFWTRLQPQLVLNLVLYTTGRIYSARTFRHCTLQLWTVHTYTLFIPEDIPDMVKSKNWL